MRYVKGISAIIQCGLWNRLELLDRYPLKVKWTSWTVEDDSVIRSKEHPKIVPRVKAQMKSSKRGYYTLTSMHKVD